MRSALPDPPTALSATSIDGEKPPSNILVVVLVEGRVLRCCVLDNSGLWLSSELLLPEGSLGVVGDTEGRELDEVTGVRNGSSIWML
jgi:hypothetical protein